jgi:DNA-binding XRE family transcriptional regulator
MSFSYKPVAPKQIVIARQPKTNTSVDEKEDPDMPTKRKAPSGKQHDKLISARREFGMTQDEFAKHAGVSKKDIAECESGKLTIPTTLWNKIEKAIISIQRERTKQKESTVKIDKDKDKKKDDETEKLTKLV